MAISFTPQQEKVLQARKHNILVSAAAGSGKTAVLVERIIRLITEGEHPSDIDRLLVVTFTRAAAAQMRERISAAIAERLQMDPSNEHLQRQETLMHNAQITTMDSFFTVIVRNQFSEIGLDPSFRQMDEDEAKILQEDVMDAYLEQLHSDADPAFLDCLAFWTQGGADTKLADYIKVLYKKAVSHPDPGDWIRSRGRDYEVRSTQDLLEKEWLKEYLGSCVEKASDLIGRYEQLIAVCEEADGPSPYETVLKREQKELLQIIRVPQETAAVYWEILRKLTAWEPQRMPTARGKAFAGVSKEKQEYVKNRRDEIRKQLKELCKNAAGTDAEKELSVMQLVDPQVQKLAELTLGFMDAFSAAKRAKNVIDFSDLEHFALQILAEKRDDGTYAPRRAALAYKKYFDEILIDEYQDSNDVQEILLRILSTEDEGQYNRFMVGDVKQSIYKFRQAKPEIFMEKYARYREDDPETERIDLDRNFRSRAEVLDSVNAVFTRVMRREIGGVQYDSTAALKVGASYHEGDEGLYRTELLTVDLAGEDEGDEEESFASLNSRKKEAMLIAGRIRQLVGVLPITENGVQRPCRFGDIVILMRTPSGKDEDFREILESQGIPVYVESRTGYFAAQEIRTILGLLKVLDNPLQDIPLYGVMYSFFGGFSEDEAAQIRVKSREGKLYNALKIYAEEESAHPQLRDRVKRFLSFVEKWRERRHWLSVHELLDELLEETGYEDYCRALPGGEQRGANLYLLKAQAVSFDAMSVSGLFSFVRYIEGMQKREIDYGEANVSGDNADVVRIMSIHKSKGLEFPVCFVAGLAGRYSFNNHDTKGAMIIDNDMGIGAELFVRDPAKHAPTLRYHAVAEKIRRDSLGEELRVLYVAMTRAQEKLILTASTKDPEKTLSRWRNSVPPEFAQERDRETHSGSRVWRLTGGEAAFPAVRISETDSYLNLLGMAVSSVQEEGTDGLFAVRFPGESEISGMVSGQEEAENLAKGRETLEHQEGPLPDPALEKELQTRFSRRYSAENLAGLCTMTSVSELKKAAMEQYFSASANDSADGEEQPGEAAMLFPPKPVFPTIPFFAQEEEPEREGSSEGAAYGTAVHRLLELLPFSRFSEGDISGSSARTKEEIVNWIKEIAEKGMIPAEYADRIHPKGILSFLQTPLARRMAAADAAGKLFREQPFVLGVPADRLQSGYPHEEMVMVQGIIDAFFEENGELVLVDYKTDRVKSAEELKNRYAVQLAYYAEALERITGRKVKEKVLYSFGLRRAVLVET